MTNEIPFECVDFEEKKAFLQRFSLHSFSSIQLKFGRVLTDEKPKN